MERGPIRARFFLMMKKEFLPELVRELEELKQRVAEQSTKVERVTGDELFEEKATLRNLVMRLEGLQLLLLKTRQQESGG